MSERINPAEIIVKSKVKQLIKEADMNASADIWNEIGHLVTQNVKVAIRRAKANGRKTVRATDF